MTSHVSNQIPILAQRLEETRSVLSSKQKLRLRKERKIHLQFVNAVRFNDLDLFYRLFQKEALKIDATDADGHTALFYAAARGNEVVAEHLLNRGAQICFKGSEARKTPLEKALKGGNKKIISLMFAKAQACDPIENRNNLLICAARGGDVESMRILLEDWKLPVNYCDAKGFSVLHYAARNQHSECVALLIAHGADIDASCRGITPLFDAIAGRDVASVKALLAAGAKVDALKSKFSPVHAAASLGESDILQLLDQAGAKFDTLDHNSCLPLHLACENGSLASVAFLLSKQVDVNQKDCEGNTPLHLAVKNHFFEIVLKLIEAKADINVENNLKKSPSYYAVKRNAFDCLEALLCHGALIQTTDGSETESPLLKAIDLRDIDAFVRLTKHAQDQIPAQRAAFMRTIHFGLFEMAKLLLDAGFNPNFKEESHQFSPLHIACYFENTKGIEFLIQICPDLLEEKDVYGATPLLFSINTKKTKSIHDLIKCGANVQAADLKYQTPLHYAVANGHVEVVELLLKKGADVNALSHSHHTPLHYAADSNSANVGKIISILLSAGADKTIQDLEGRDSVEIAKIRGHDVALALFNGVPLQSRQGVVIKENDKESKLTRHKAKEELRKKEELNQVKESKNARRKRQRNLSKVKIQPMTISQPSIPTTQLMPSGDHRQLLPQLVKSDEENEVVEKICYFQDCRRPEDGIKYVKSADSDCTIKTRKMALKVPKYFQKPLSEKGVKLLAFARKHLRKVNRLLEIHKFFFGDKDGLTSGLLERAMKYNLLKLFEALHPTNSNDFFIDSDYLAEVGSSIMEKDLILKFRNAIRHETHILDSIKIFNIASLLQKTELDQKMISLENSEMRTNPFTEMDLRGFDFSQISVRDDSTLETILNRIKEEIEFIHKVDTCGKKLDFVTKNALKMSLSYLGVYLQNLKTFCKTSNTASRKIVSQGIRIGHYYDSNLLGQKDITNEQLNQLLLDIGEILSLVNLIKQQTE